MMKKFLSLLLALCLACSLCSFAAAEETRTFVDSTGREVTLPANITRIAISGPLAQIFVFALAPEMLVGIANAWDKSAEGILPTEYYNLPLLGQLYGGKGEMNLETLLAAAPDVVIDVGEPKKTVKEDLDALTEQTGIPFVHITTHTGTAGDAYRKLGELLGKQEEAEELAAYCENVMARAKKIADSVEKANILYVSGTEGLNVIAKGSYHAEVIDMLANNLAAVDNPSSKGTGNEVDMEQILAWNPDFVIFAPGSIYSTVADNENWQTIPAIRDGRYYEVPMGPYNWMGFPPSVQRLLGVMWMEKVLYPEAADYDMYEEVKTYFDLFYHCELTQELYQQLTANSFVKE